MSIKTTNKASLARTRNRRFQKRRECDARQHRWQDARLIIDASKAVLCGEEDARIVHEINRLIYRLDQFSKHPAEDDERILAAIEAGCWVTEDIADETGLPEDYIAELLENLREAGRLRQSGEGYWRLGEAGNK